MFLSLLLLVVINYQFEKILQKLPYIIIMSEIFKMMNICLVQTCLNVLSEHKIRNFFFLHRVNRDNETDDAIVIVSKPPEGIVK